jgi:localization factor PodJL
MRPEARETAKEAARRAGMSLEDWLDAVISKEAGNIGAHPRPPQGDSDSPASESEPKPPEPSVSEPVASGPALYAPRRMRNERSPTSVASPERLPLVQLPPALEQALAEIAARQRVLDSDRPPVAKNAPPAEAEPSPESPPQELASAEPPTVSLPEDLAPAKPSLEPQVSESSAPPPSAAAAPEPPAPPQPSMPAQNLAGLEAQLRNITCQIETLRQPGVSEAINALRVELAEISYRLNEAMPRDAIEAIEAQIQGLSLRVAEGRQAGVDDEALARIENGIAQVHDALRALTPAESLVGYHETAAQLAEKIDLIVAQRDPAAMQQLHSSITTLREMASHVASNETVSRLAAEVQQLAENVDRIARASTSSDVLFNIEQHLAAFSDALAERKEQDEALPPQLEARVGELLDKVEQLQQQPSMAPELRQAIATLLDMADHAASNETMNQLTAEVHQLADNVEHIARNGASGEALFNIEHRLAAMSDALERMQSSAAASPHFDTLLQSLYEKVEQLQYAPDDHAAIAHLEESIVKLAEKLDAMGSRFAQLDAIEGGVGDLLTHIEALRSSQETGEQANAGTEAYSQDLARTQDALEAMHETLSHVVDRLAMIEQDIREGAGAPSTAMASYQTVGNLAVSVPAETAPLVPSSAPVVQPPVPAVVEAATAAPDLMPAVSPEPEESDLSPDRPLEPGSGQPNSPAARVAASEAALGDAKPTPTPDQNNRSNFIAAARRAAQAAAQEQNQRKSRGEAGTAEASDASSLRSRLMHRVKTLFIAASVIAIVVGSVQTASKFHVLGFGASNAPTNKIAKKADTAMPADDQAKPNADALAAASIKSGAASTAPEQAASAAPTKPETANSTPAAGVIVPGANRGMQSLLSAPGAGYPFDITGSIPNGNKLAAASAPATGDLPAAIGGVQLRSAAIAGDADAAYEVGLHYAEGQGVPVDLAQAAHWFEQAAAKGLAPAQFRLASLLEKGQGVAKDLVRAEQLYLAAANKGNAKAMHNLAVLYAEGVNGKSDYPTAVKWFRKAAERGVPDSQFNLGVLAGRGVGMKADLSEAYKWFALAAKQGDREAAKKRDDLAGQLDAKALATVQHVVDTFVPKKQPAEAITVPTPPGGWDSASSEPATKAH